MNKVYIFGAGNNAYGVVSYIGCENVIAIIDNEKKKQGNIGESQSRCYNSYPADYPL